MVSEQKVRMMIRLADYESHEGKQDFARTKYYKMDYIRLQILKTLVCVTCAVVLIAVIAGLYNMEYLITNALELDYLVLQELIRYYEREEEENGNKEERNL